MNHLRRQFPVWGTIVDVDCYSQSVGGADLDIAMESVIAFCEVVDQDFSTYKDGSWVTRLRRGAVAIEDCPDDVREVWDLCLRAKDLSDGAFDPWAVAGGFDPSGLVKGWAADKCADFRKNFPGRRAGAIGPDLLLLRCLQKRRQVPRRLHKET